MRFEKFVSLNQSMGVLVGDGRIDSLYPITVESIAGWNARISSSEYWGEGSEWRILFGDDDADNAIKEYSIHKDEVDYLNRQMGEYLRQTSAAPKGTICMQDDDGFDPVSQTVDPSRLLLPAREQLEGGCMAPTAELLQPENTALQETNPEFKIDFLDDASVGRAHRDHSNQQRKSYASHAGLKTDYMLGTSMFRYSQDGFLQGVYMAADIDKFIRLRDKTNKIMLVLQRAPFGGDGRVAGQRGPTCLCAECPLRRLAWFGIAGAGMIFPGEYMVALDEFVSERERGMNIHPYAVAGYIHLYCFERFLNNAGGLAYFLLDSSGDQLAETVRVLLDSCRCENMPSWHKPLPLTTRDNEIIRRFMASLQRHGMGFRLAYPNRRAFAGATGCFAGTLTNCLHEMSIRHAYPSPDRNYVGNDTMGHANHVYRGDLEVLYAGIMMREDRSYELTFEQRDVLSNARKPWFLRSPRQFADGSVDGRPV